MALNLLKLCVGCDSVEDLEEWIASRLDEKRRAGLPIEHFHTTRMVPTRADEVTSGGSLYWVIKGSIVCRMPIADISTKGEGKQSRCLIRLHPEVIRTAPLGHRPFQGWRYLEARDAPLDLSRAEATDLPDDLVKQLRSLGAW